MSQVVNWKRFKDLIDGASTILLTAHQRPDGDCLGSEIAMFHAFRGLGKEVRIVNPHPTPPTLAFVDPERLVRSFESLTDVEKVWMDQVDLFLVLDTSSWAQLGMMAETFKASKAKKIVIDHHIKGDDIGAERFVNHGAEATGILVVEAVEALGVPLDKAIADAAFVAIATDTGWFRFRSVGAETFRIVAKLVDAGASPDDMFRELHEQESLGRIRLIGRTLSKTESYFDGRVMLTWILLDDLEQAGALPSDTEDIVNMILQVKDSKIATLISELRDGTFKISFRSRCAVDCSLLAAQFNGGGHKAAAGASSSVTFEETKSAILQAIGKALDDCDEQNVDG